MENRRKDINKRVKSFYNPPHLLLKQAVAIVLYAMLSSWNKKAFLLWTSQLKNLIHAGAGAKQISCFGLSPHVVWEMTGRCNLDCIHCHAFGGAASYDELTEEEGRALIDQIAALDIRSFVFTGGEPLLREDIFELIAYAKSIGFSVFIATNGTLIINFFGRFFGGCLAGKGMMYIKPNGDVWACPFLPANVGNVRKDRIDMIWRALEKIEFAKGECNGCEYEKVCGGCKARIGDWDCPLRDW